MRADVLTPEVVLGGSVLQHIAHGGGIGLNAVLQERQHMVNEGGPGALEPLLGAGW
jgi:hypothetical protein